MATDAVALPPLCLLERGRSVAELSQLLVTTLVS